MARLAANFEGFEEWRAEWLARLETKAIEKLCLCHRAANRPFRFYAGILPPRCRTSLSPSGIAILEQSRSKMV